MQNRNGITLIALIITIIVMLILAGVAISSIVGENGIIERAETASVEMEKKEILEKVQISTTYNMEGNIDLKTTFDNIKSNLKEENVTLLEPTDENQLLTVSEAKIKVKGDKGEYEYTLKSNNIEITPPKPRYADYNVGDTVYYDENADGVKSSDEKWYVFTKSEDENSIEIIRARSIGLLWLGSGFENFGKFTVTDQDGNGVIDGIDRAIYAYNNSDEIINEYCKLQVKAEDNDGVRSIDSTCSKKAIYSFTKYLGGVNWIKEIPLYKRSEYATESVKAVNEMNLTIQNTWWTPSMYVSEYKKYCKGFVRIANVGGVNQATEIWYVKSDNTIAVTGNTAYTKAQKNGVLPIVTNPVNISLEP